MQSKYFLPVEAAVSEIQVAVPIKLSIYEEFASPQSKVELSNERAIVEMTRKLKTTDVSDEARALTPKLDRKVELKEEQRKADSAKAEQARLEKIEVARIKENRSSALEQLELAKAIVAEKRVVKPKKQAIPKKVKTDVWNTYIGADINAHRCLCCKKTRIQLTDFQVGHVQSEKFGGTMEIGNLRPICSACNSSMGSQNMIEFVKTYGYYIG